MPSSFSPSLRIELIAPGEQAGTWGTTTNTNLGTLIESAVAGLQTVSVISGNQALTIADGAADQSRSAVLRFTTTTGAPFNVYAPPVSKQYTIVNASAHAMTIFASTVAGNTTAAGTGVIVPVGASMTVRTDGVDFTQQNTHFTTVSIAGGTINNTVIGGSTAAAGTFTNLAYTGTLTGGTGVINIGSGQFYKDASGNVGIGTSSPTQRVTIQTTTNGDGVRFFNNDSTSGSFSRIGFQSANLWDTSSVNAAIDAIKTATGTATNIRFLTAGDNNTGSAGLTERMRITAAGNVGIGVVPSAWGSIQPALQVGQDASLSSRANTADLMLNAYFDGSNYRYVGSFFASRYQQQDGSHRWAVAPSGTAGNTISFSEAVRITSAGNVGIGTSSPVSPLHVVGASMRVGSVSDPGDFTLGTDRAGGALLFRKSENTTDRYLALGAVDNNFAFTERMRIDSAGNVGIGTSSPTQRLSVVTPTAAAIRIATGTAAASTASLLLEVANNFSGTSQAFVQCIGSGASGVSQLAFGTAGSTGDTTATERMRIDSAGNLLIQGTTNPSDFTTIRGSSQGLLVGSRSFIASPSGDTVIGGLLGSTFTDIYAGGVLNARFTGGTFQFNSGYGSVATAYACRAWVNFNGVGGATIRGSGGVSSVARLSTGEYRVNFSFTFPDANYAACGSCGEMNVRQGYVTQFSLTTTTAQFKTGVPSADQDHANVYVSFFR